jgi:hypothetical protein
MRRTFLGVFLANFTRPFPRALSDSPARMQQPNFNVFPGPKRPILGGIAAKFLFFMLTKLGGSSQGVMYLIAALSRPIASGPKAVTALRRLEVG